MYTFVYFTLLVFKLRQKLFSQNARVTPSLSLCVSTLSLNMEIVQRRGELIKFQQGYITNQNVYAIINFVYAKGYERDLDGTLAAAGASVVTEYEKECSKENRLVRRGIVVTTAGNLPIKNIFHCIVNDRPEKMKDALSVALRQADRE